MYNKYGKCTLFLLIKTQFGLEVYDMKEISNTFKEDDCCMTATTNTGVYVVGKQKADADKHPKADAKRIAEAVERTAMYGKK